MNLSKSKYCRGLQCPKMLWMDMHMPEEATDLHKETIFAIGNEVGDLAMGYFGDFVEVPFDINVSTMIAKTSELLAAGEKIICEASFTYNGNFCSVDILRVLEDGVEIYEVKSSTSVKNIYLDDMAYQMYVLQGCGLNVTKVCNMHINNQYERHGELDLQQLFTIEDCTEQCIARQADIEEKITNIKTIAGSETMPTNDIGEFCSDPYDCAYWAACLKQKGIASPNIFDVRGMQLNRKFKFYKAGVITFEDLVAHKEEITPSRYLQVDTEYNNKPPVIDKKAIQAFLDTLSYPLYFLDFETCSFAIPPFDGVKPNQKIAFQYSLHVLKEIDGDLEHYEFLGKEGTDPRRALAEQLVKDIPLNVCSLAYNSQFEKGVMRGLGELFPDLQDHLLNIVEHMEDLQIPFQKRAFYCKELQGSYSIKEVLPALCPGDPELDYHALEGVQNGGDAMDAFPQMAHMSPEEVAEKRMQLLAYCRLDTLAMVKILEKLREMAK